MSFGLFSFLTPLPLLGLIALSVIWWLLRSTPPSPDRQVFPQTRILKRLLQNETTAAKSPGWLTVLRLIVAAFVIFALAQPVLNSAKPLLAADETDKSAETKKGPVVLMVDNGWASATDWELRKIMMSQILTDAQQQERLVFLLPTVPEKRTGVLTPISALDALNQLERIEPSPFHSAPATALENLQEGLKTFTQGNDTLLQNSALYWLADGLNHDKTETVQSQLKTLKEAGFRLHLILPNKNTLPLALSARLGQGGVLYGMVKATPSETERAGVVLALSGQEEVLGRAAFVLPPKQTSVEARIDLPLEIRNQIKKLKIEGQNSGGSVYLLDQRSNWRRVGLISNERGERAQPLLSPLHYIRRALEPFAELVNAASGEMAKTIDSFTEQNISVIVMADIGRLVGEPLLRLTEWVEKGGVLVRFAGPHMEESQDRLLPTPLRQGGRRLGGSLSWTKPQTLATFDEQSPFSGLAIPEDVVVTRQLLADPSRLSDKVQIWARLNDGTPLVTATREMDGWVVLVHVTANSDWSNLAHSGLFVEMLQRLTQLSVGGLGGHSQKGSSESVAQKTDGGEDASALRQANEVLLSPHRSLNGFGRLITPPVTVEPIAYRDLNKLKISTKHPPGFYGPVDQTVALNLMEQTTELQNADYSNIEASILPYRKAPERALRGPLFIAAFLLLILDSLIVLFMRGVFSFGRLRQGVAVGLFFSLLFFSFVSLVFFLTSSPSVRAQEIDQIPPPVEEGELKSSDMSSLREKELNLPAALKTHLAYVITGDSKVDQTSRDGLRGLNSVLNRRTAVEPAEPIGINLDRDELAFYPLLYWPVGTYSQPLSDKLAQRINSYMKHGGMIIFDTKDQDSRIAGMDGSAQPSLQKLLSKLDIPRIEPVPSGHVLTKSFYLLSSFPGRFQGGDLWVEATSRNSGSKSSSDIDGVSTLLITSNDLASAWAVDENNQAKYPVVPGGEGQREMAYRVGVNIVMYALAGNYKADQVHVPALLERLGQ